MLLKNGWLIKKQYFYLLFLLLLFVCQLSLYVVFSFRTKYTSCEFNFSHIQGGYNLKKLKFRFKMQEHLNKKVKNKIKSEDSLTY